MRKEEILFNKVIKEIQNFCFNTTNLIDDLSTDENEQQKEIVENEIINMLSKAKITDLNNKLNK